MKELEIRLSEYLQVPEILIVNNGTIALQFAIRSLQLSGEVITTPFSYVATVSSLVWEQCVPRFVDIDPHTLTIDASKIREAITPQTKGILATHVYGNPCPVEEIEKIGKEFGLKIIYDAAHCFGVRYNGKSLLEWGDVSTLSFHATKLFHTGEGGGIVCRESQTLNEIKYLHNFGHEGVEKYHGVGINGKISELHAAMGLAVLPYIPELIQKRKEIVERYRAGLANSVLKPIKIRPGTDWNFSYFPVIFPSERSLKSALSRLAEMDIFPRRYFHPSLNHLPYLDRFDSCPIAEDISNRVLCLPLYDALDFGDVDRICETLILSEA